MEENDFIFYNSKENKVKVLIDGEDVWLSQKKIAEIFNVDVRTVNEHIQNILESTELTRETTVRKFRIVALEGQVEKTREILHYNVDMIVSVGYRVNSYQATQFRKWATSVLKEYMIKGFTLDDERLKQGKNLFGKDYFKELLERVRSIRSSERRIWQQITDIFSECSTDYDKNSRETTAFYASVQNKFHYAITGQTGAEIIYLVKILKS